ncbi:MAG: hypothetical protein ABI379_05280, partial [Rhodanobacter sp.]
MKPVGIFIERLLASLMLMSMALGAVAAGVSHGKIQRHGPSGAVHLVAQGAPVKFEVDGLCRYDPRSDRWSR